MRSGLKKNAGNIVLLKDNTGRSINFNPPWPLAAATRQRHPGFMVYQPGVLEISPMISQDQRQFRRPGAFITAGIVIVRNAFQLLLFAM